MSTTKSSFVKRSIPPKSDAPGGSQSAAERKAAEVELAALVARFAPDSARLVASMRRTLRKRLPTAHELVYEYRDCFVTSFSPSGHGHEGVFAIRGSTDGIRLYFNAGKVLSDPEGLLQGTGGKVRWIPVEAAAVLTRPGVVGLMDEAMAANRVPFDRDGGGSVVVRPTAAKERSASTRPAGKRSAATSSTKSRSATARSRVTRKKPSPST